MSIRKENYFQTQLFKPSKVRDPYGTGKVPEISLSKNAQDIYGMPNPTGSFNLDPSGSPFKNTQQLNVDFSKFENHTFFNSARGKTHVAIEKIINTYPFDGTRRENEKFFDSLTGYEKYVFDRFPKNAGFLIFSRSMGIEGNFLSVRDIQGVGEIEGKKLKTAEPKLNFKSGPFSIEFSVFVPSGSTNDNEVIAQRLVSHEKGFTIALSSSQDLASPEGEVDVVMGLSDVQDYISTSARIKKGVFNKIAAVYDRGETNRISLYVNGHKVSSSPQSQIGNFDFTGTNFLIGSGSSHKFSDQIFTPVQTLSGALDEFRFFLSERKNEDIKEYGDREIFAQSDLALYFRFNEPSGSFSKFGVGNQSLTLDHSGNGLHTQVTNFDINNRNKSLVPITNNTVSENPKNSPVLFPTFEGVSSLAAELMLSASRYDANNPNLITKMVPRHYLDDSAINEGFSSIDGELDQLPGVTSDRPGGNSMKQSQMISSVLFTWAALFDELKMFVDEFGRLHDIDPSKPDTVSDQMIGFLAKYHGFSLPTQFNSSNFEQFLEGRKLTVDAVKSNMSLQYIQNQLWKRILSDLTYIRKTKGTRASFRSVLRNMGINPDGPFRFREYGGARTTRISDSFENKIQVGAMLNFSGTLSPAGTIDTQGKDDSRPLLVSHYLSSSRSEIGKPDPRGSLTPKGSTEPGDGLLTSGSWSFEGLYKFESKVKHKQNQSLVRIQSTGSEGNTGNNWLLYNVIAVKPTPQQTGSITLYGSPTSGSHDPILNLSIEDINIFDGKKWHISFGRKRNDESSHHTSSYFLRAGKHSRNSTFLTESLGYYFDSIDSPLNVITSSNNASGSFVTIGSMSLNYDKSSTLKHLNDVPYANYVEFSGKVAGLRFFSKALSKKETLTHVKNWKSVGVENPNVNFSFTSKATGSFEKLRVDISLDQVVTKSDSQGNLQAFDFSQNLFHGTLTGFEKNKQVIDPETYDYQILSPKFEKSSYDNRIRIRGFQRADLVESENAQFSPMREIPPEEKPFDDRRVEVEISSVQALNEDIMNIFSTLDYFDNAIGDPELVFSTEYRDLRHMRRVYFNRLDDKISIKKFFDFFKWFDMSVGDIFEELVPRNSRYLGTNFVLENHALERPKFKYNYTDIYLGELERRAGSAIYLQQFIGTIRKF